MTMGRANVHKIINDTHSQSEEFGDESELINDLNFDGLDFVNLAMTLEEELGIDFTDEQAMQCETVGDVVNVVEVLAAMERTGL